MKTGWIVPTVLIGLGAVCLAAGILNYQQQEVFFATAEHATAAVTDYVSDPNPKVADYCPVYAFTTQAGQAITYIGADCLAQPDAARLGQTEEIYFDPQFPHIIRTRGLGGSEANNLWAGVFAAVTFVFVGLMAIWAPGLKRRAAGR